MPSPFDLARQQPERFIDEGITIPQRKALRAMMLEKAELKGMNLDQADDKVDTWLAELTKERAKHWIRETGRWLDNERRRRGLPLNTRGTR